MRETLPLNRSTRISKEAQQPASAAFDRSAAVAEIHGYLAARNLLLRMAEENTTEANLRRAAAANDFAENCLHPVRSPYQAQSLPEADAARERQHCKAVKVRIAELRARAGLRHRAA